MENNGEKNNKVEDLSKKRKEKSIETGTKAMKQGTPVYPHSHDVFDQMKEAEAAKKNKKK
jgi:hypothetical protein